MSKSKKSYFDLLRDPQWQKKRLEIMERDRFKCKRCDCDDKTLNVHHTYYEKGKSPWEYPAYSLHTLCEECHEIIQEHLATLHRAIGLLAFEQIEELTGYAYGLSVMDYSLNDTPPVCALTSAYDVDGFVRALMTHNGPGAHKPFNAAADRIVGFLMDGNEEIGFLDAIDLCYPPKPEPEPALAASSGDDVGAYEWM
jgi:hypothetical protein